MVNYFSDQTINIDLNILTGCDGSGKTSAFRNVINSTPNDNNIIFESFPQEHTRDVIDSLPAIAESVDPLIRHKIFEVDFHDFFEQFNNKHFLISSGFDLEQPIKVLTDRFFPCNMAYGLYHTDNKIDLKILDFMHNFINFKNEDNDQRRLNIHIIHITPDVSKWIEYNGDNMTANFLFEIESMYNKVYNYLQENYTVSDLEMKGVNSLKITKLYNNYNGNIENEIHNLAKIPKI